MNRFDATTRPVPGGHIAMVRLAHHAEPKPVLGKGGRPQVYADKDQAWRAAVDRLCGWLNGNLRRDGEKLTAANQAAENLFKRRRG